MAVAKGPKAPTLKVRREVLAEVISTPPKGFSKAKAEVWRASMGEAMTAERIDQLVKGEAAIVLAGDPVARLVVDTEARWAKALGLAGYSTPQLAQRAAFDAGQHEAPKAPAGSGRVIGQRADEGAMLAHIDSWLARFGPRGSSKAHREYQAHNPGQGCWPVYQRLWGEATGDAHRLMVGRAMADRAASYGPGFADEVRAYIAAKADEGDATAVAALKSLPTPTVEAPPVEAPKAPAKAPAKARKAAAPKAPKAPRKAPAAKAPKAPATKAAS